MMFFFLCTIVYRHHHLERIVLTFSKHLKQIQVYKELCKSSLEISKVSGVGKYHQVVISTSYGSVGMCSVESLVVGEKTLQVSRLNGNFSIYRNHIVLSFGFRCFLF